MQINSRETKNNHLLAIAQSLELSETDRKRATKAYETVGEWITGGESPLNECQIYPQRSFNLGTEIKPISDSDEYDIDLVCEFPYGTFTDPQQLKQIVGRRLKENKTYNQKLEPEGKRCWTLCYEIFHMDILPAQLANFESLGSTEIFITNREITNRYSCKSSNPKAYARWFHTRGRGTQGLRVVAGVEEVPDYNHKTILQRCVQLFKRHRDCYYSNKNNAEKENAPISIIITTLAAQSYRLETDLLKFMKEAVIAMEQAIQPQNGRYTIHNPVDNRENFADKWNSNNNLPKEFSKWLTQIASDLELLDNCVDPNTFMRHLEKMFGESMTRKAITAFQLRNQGKLHVNSEGNLTTKISAGAVAIPTHTFYGRSH